jgi:hypothetical protein
MLDTLSKWMGFYMRLVWMVLLVQPAICIGRIKESFFLLRLDWRWWMVFGSTSQIWRVGGCWIESKMHLKSNRENGMNKAVISQITGPIGLQCYGIWSWEGMAYTVR